MSKLMLDDEKRPIKIKIDGFIVPLIVPRNDEQIYRDAEKLVMHYLDKYAKKYNQRSYEEILKLTAYQLAVIISQGQSDTETLIKELEKSLSDD
ncbi:MAG: cell division protein ZapA [Paludibacter sp.]|nr:cell division protein ZapA [Paludibacter sp.]